MDLLNKGLKHSLPPLNQKASIDRLIIDLETQVCFNNELIAQCADLIHNNPPEAANLNTKKKVRNIQNKLKEGNAIITKADKGQSLVILKKPEYHAKMLEFLHGSNATINPEFNFNTFVENIRKAINKSEHIFKTPAQKKKVLIPNPIPPRLHGLAKKRSSYETSRLIITAPT